MARGLHKLSAGDLRRKDPGLYNDGGGLYLQIKVGPDDAVWRSWIGRYSHNGRTRDMGLGPVAEVGLAEVRKRWHGELRPLLRQDIDPIEHRKAGRLAQAAAAARSRTLEQCIDAYHQAHRGTWRSAKHAREWLKSLQTCFASLLALPVTAVDIPDIMRCLEPYWREAEESAQRTAQRLEKVLDWAITAGYRAGPNPARWANGLKLLLPRTKSVADTRHAALAYQELPAFVAKLRASGRADALAMEFLIMTATRTGEVRFAVHPEIDEADAIWVIPGARMKAGKEHRVPLSPRALEILAQLPRTSEFVFPGERSGGAMSAAALLRLPPRLGYPGITTHGFRASFKTWAEETTSFPREVIEQALAHSVGNAVEEAYRRGDLLEKRRRLMEAWANYLARPLAPATVTPFRRHA
jgi:integrase